MKQRISLLALAGAIAFCSTRMDAFLGPLKIIKSLFCSGQRELTPEEQVAEYSRRVNDNIDKLADTRGRISVGGCVGNIPQSDDPYEMLMNAGKVEHAKRQEFARGMDTMDTRLWHEGQMTNSLLERTTPNLQRHLEKKYDAMLAKSGIKPSEVYHYLGVNKGYNMDCGMLRERAFKIKPDFERRSPEHDNLPSRAQLTAFRKAIISIFANPYEKHKFDMCVMGTADMAQLSGEDATNARLLSVEVSRQSRMIGSTQDMLRDL